MEELKMQCLKQLEALILQRYDRSETKNILSILASPNVRSIELAQTAYLQGIPTPPFSRSVHILVAFLKHIDMFERFDYKRVNNVIDYVYFFKNKSMSNTVLSSKLEALERFQKFMFFASMYLENLEKDPNYYK